MMIRLLITTLLLCGPACAGTAVIDDFNSGVGEWKPEMEYGEVANTRVSEGKGADDSGALTIDYDFRAAGTNHIIFAKSVDLDLASAAGIEFDVKGSGDRANLFVHIWDSTGQFSNYGPHGTNPDFHTGHADWHECAMHFGVDAPVQGGVTDLADIKRIGFMVNGGGPIKGSVTIENLRIVQGADRLTVSPSVISPNGDGLNDKANVTVYMPDSKRVNVEVFDKSGKLVATILRNAISEGGRVTLAWSAGRAGTPLPNGTYEVVATFSGQQKVKSSAKITIQSFRKWPPLQYKAEPFFPIGVWFEGDPAAAGYPAEPAGAKAYYDRCFADLAAHGLNTVAVPNCPEELWTTLLASAQANRIKVVLEVGPLTALVSRTEPASEKEAYDAAKAVVDKIGKYPSLLRYQVRDEPFVQMIPNWILVQRVLAALDPKRPAFSCFCSPDALAYLTGRTELSEAVFDIYPFGPVSPPQTMGGFVNSLDAFTRASRDNVKWAVLQAFAKPGAWRYPSAEELRAQTYLSLAAGAKGVFYFIYQTMPDHPEKLEGLIDPQGKPLPLYGPTSELAGELSKLAPLVLSLKPAEQTVEVEGSVRSGSFVDGSGSPVLIVASTDPGKAVEAGVSDGNAWKDFLTGETFAPVDGSVTLGLAPGAGRVLVR